MQGLVALEPNLAKVARMRDGEGVSTDELVRRFTNVIVNGVRGLQR
jgi:hypothetical protein